MPNHFPVRRVTPQLTLQLGLSTEISPKPFYTVVFFRTHENTSRFIHTRENTFKEPEMHGNYRQLKRYIPNVIGVINFPAHLCYDHPSLGMGEKEERKRRKKKKKKKKESRERETLVLLPLMLK